MTKEAFKIAVPDSVLTDLRERLSHVRYPIDFANENWAYGTNRAYLEEMVAYWRDQYDWRKHEAEINRFAHYRTTIDGVPIQLGGRRSARKCLVTNMTAPYHLRK